MISPDLHLEKKNKKKTSVCPVYNNKHVGCYVRQHTFWNVRLAKIQISLRIRAVWSESSLSAWRNFVSLPIQNVSSEDSDQTARMRSLIRILAGRTCSKMRFLL